MQAAGIINLKVAILADKPVAGPSLGTEFIFTDVRKSAEVRGFQSCEGFDVKEIACYHCRRKVKSYLTFSLLFS